MLCTAPEWRFVMEITDNGQGFNVSELQYHEGLGLKSMRERAEGVGGRLCVESSPGEGTRVKLEIPLVNMDVEVEKKG